MKSQKPTRRRPSAAAYGYGLSGNLLEGNGEERLFCPGRLAVAPAGLEGRNGLRACRAVHSPLEPLEHPGRVLGHLPPGGLTPAAALVGGQLMAPWIKSSAEPAAVTFSLHPPPLPGKGPRAARPAQGEERGACRRQPR